MRSSICDLLVAHLVSFRLMPPSRFEVKNQSAAPPIESKTTVSGIAQNENGHRSLRKDACKNRERTEGDKGWITLGGYFVRRYEGVE